MEEAVRALSTLRGRHNHHHPVKLGGLRTFDLLYHCCYDRLLLQDFLTPSLLEYSLCCLNFKEATLVIKVHYYRTSTIELLLEVSWGRVKKSKCCQYWRVGTGKGRAD